MEKHFVIIFISELLFSITSFIITRTLKVLLIERANKMKKQFKALLGAFFSVVLIASTILPVLAAKITTTPSGYTSSSDVEYKYDSSGKYILNWGARGEVCEFLSPNAQSYYVGNYTYDVLSGNQGGSDKSNAPSSALYKALKAMMVAEHSHITAYKETRYLYRYTDCLLNDDSHISSFYSGTVLSGTWDSGKTWNREHTWPNSKGLGGSDEDDIMMLRPTSVSENSSRGNTAYGEGSSYYDPGESVRGDCARIVLYVYVRWGNTSKMWGTGGVMESLDVLLKWMEEDPVDTWEMGRNDAVESITGVRNVFVDYPEYAWLLFGEEIPDAMPTPSGIAKNGTQDDNQEDETPDQNEQEQDKPNQDKQECAHTATRTVNQKDATCTENGYTGDVYCNDCNELVKKGTTIIATGHTEELQGLKDATCTEDGYNGDLVCKDCGTLIQQGQVVPSTGNHTFGNWEVVEEATDTKDGYREHKCIYCDYKETESIPAEGSLDEDNKGDESGNNESSNEGNLPAQNNPSDKKDLKKTLIIGTAIVVPSGCVVGIGLRFFLKRRAIR